MLLVGTVCVTANGERLSPASQPARAMLIKLAEPLVVFPVVIFKINPTTTPVYSVFFRLRHIKFDFYASNDRKYLLIITINVILEKVLACEVSSNIC